VSYVALDHVVKAYEQLLCIDLDRLQRYANFPADSSRTLVSDDDGKVKSNTMVHLQKNAECPTFFWNI
jgi:hypothetical protein